MHLRAIAVALCCVFKACSHQSIVSVPCVGGHQFLSLLATNLLQARWLPANWLQALLAARVLISSNACCHLHDGVCLLASCLVTSSRAKAWLSTLAGQWKLTVPFNVLVCASQPAT